MISNKSLEYMYQNLDELDASIQGALDEEQDIIDQLKEKQFIARQVRHLLDSGSNAEALELFFTGLYNG